MNSVSSFTENAQGGFVGRERWESKESYNKKIKHEKNELQKKILGIKRDIEETMYEFGEML